MVHHFSWKISKLPLPCFTMMAMKSCHLPYRPAIRAVEICNRTHVMEFEVYLFSEPKHRVVDVSCSVPGTLERLWLTPVDGQQRKFKGSVLIYTLGLDSKKEHRFEFFIATAAICQYRLIDYSSCPVQKLWQAALNGCKTDVEFTVGLSKFTAHRFILAAR